MFTSLLRRFPWLDSFIASPGREANLRVLLIREASGTFVLRIFALGMGFITTWVLARILSATEYGAYRYGVSWLMLLAVPGMLGMHRLVLREVSAYSAQAAWDWLHGLVRRSYQVVLAASLVTMVAVGGVGWLIVSANDSLKLYVLLLTLLMLPVTTLTSLRQAVMQGLNWVVLSQLPEMLVQPVLFLALSGAAYGLLPGDWFSVYVIVVCHSVAMGVAFGLGTRMQRRVMPPDVRAAVPRYQTRTWMSAALPLLFANGINILNMQATSIILGTLEASALVAVYTIANQGAMLIVFVYMAANNTLAPTFARLYVKRDMARLQQVATQSARLVFLCSLPVALPLMLFPAEFMGVFGEQYRAGATTLLILAGAQVFNAITGSGGWLLIMTGHERYIAWATVAAVAVNIGANMLLVPIYGLNGAAVATAASIVVQNALATWYAWRTTGIHVTALGRLEWLNRK